MPVNRKLLQRLALDAKYDTGDQPTRLAQLDHGDQCLRFVRELRGICSNRSAVAWSAPLIRWCDDGAIVLAARPIASAFALSNAGR